MSWPFKKKGITGQVTNQVNSVPDEKQENVFDRVLNLHPGRMVFLEGVPFYVSKLEPKNRSITLVRFTENQWKRLQEKAKEMALAQAKKTGPSEPKPGEAEGISGV